MTSTETETQVSEQQVRLDAEFLEQLRAVAEQIQPKGIAPAGNRVITAKDLAQACGANSQWWERHRQRLVDAGLLIKAGRKFIGDMSKIQAAIVDPELWADATE
jgi:hypothetical protein